MRLSVITALLSMGFFAGCGGVEMEERDVSAQVLTPCERACVSAWTQCEGSASTPEQYAVCDERAGICFSRCDVDPASVGPIEGGSATQAERQDAEVTGLDFTQCWNRCVATHQGCLQNATTPEVKEFCDKKFRFCVDACERGTPR